MPVSIVDTIPQVDSAETDQNSQPSITVNPPIGSSNNGRLFRSRDPYFIRFVMQAATSSCYGPWQ